MPNRIRPLAAASLVALASVPASATWSIVIINTRTREVALGSATCLTNFDLQANTPVMVVGVGGATAQSYVDSTGQNRIFIRDHLLEGTDPWEILNLLSDFDAGHQTRQYGIGDTTGRAATFSGTGDGQWAGGVTGQVGDLVYAVQGNVLTGEPVVAAAELAILDTPGDIPEKMMAAMEAARFYGGDGRCSCAPNAPDSCGSPPPPFEKAAHIAYMIDARIGDRDGSNGIYRAGTSTSSIASHDFNGDGLPDLVASATSSTGLSLLINRTRPGDTFVTFEQAQTIPLAAYSRDVAVADLNGDGQVDLIAANYAVSAVSILMGKPGGGFGDAYGFGVGTDPRFLVIADIDGDSALDIATANIGGSSISLLFGDGKGGFSPAETIGVGGGIANIAAADVDGDNDLDVVFAAQNLGAVATILNLGNRQFQFGQPLPTGGSPKYVLSRDIDHDGRTDLAVATGSGGTVCILWNREGGFERQDLSCGGSTNTLGVGDANGDGLDDILVMRTSPNDFIVFTGDGQVGFAPSAAFADAPGNARCIPADLDGDGLDDLAAVTGSAKSVYIIQNLGEKNGPVLFNSGLGAATGDYFMDFNIANQKQEDPDPVFTLRDRFDAWRAGLVGHPDAGASIAVITPEQLPADGASQATLLVTLQDWQGQPVAGDPSLTVAHAPGVDPVCAIGPVVDLGGGKYSIVLTAGSTPGVDEFRIVADDGSRPVTLTPDPSLSLVSACAADCDGDGALSLFDFLCFVNLFNAGETGADCDGSGGLDLFDFLCFTNSFNKGC